MSKCLCASKTEHVTEKTYLTAGIQFEHVKKFCYLGDMIGEGRRAKLHA
jgi:hypothetical protein